MNNNLDYNISLEDVYCGEIRRYNGPKQEIWLTENMLAKLLVDEVCFINTAKLSFNEEKTIAVYVQCSDTFYYSTADGECITLDDLPALFKMHMEDPVWGSTKWVCKKRNLQPIGRIVEMMKKAEAWDDLMDSLEKNKW